MAKIIKITDTKAYRVSVIRMADDKSKTKLLSIRQLYKTKKEPDEWKPGYQGLTVPLDDAGRLIKALTKVADDPDQKVEVIEKKEKK